MCGITGFIHNINSHKNKNSDWNKNLLEKMMARIKHRGPDGNGQWHSIQNNWSISLGHTRLAIIDLAGGKQPMSTLSNKSAITFNGEIYNFLDLKNKISDIRFSTNSDTEVLLYWLKEHGLKKIADLNGMFAFAFWDEQTNSLILARDRAGIKPLYYSPLKDGGIAFGSELTTLLAHHKENAEVDFNENINSDALMSYFFSDYTQAPLTFFKSISKLEPGHFLIWSNGNLSAPKEFWTLNAEVNQDLMGYSTSRISKLLQEKISVAVQRQSIADVPIGVFLSGGIDSSTIAASAQEHSPFPINTFSIGFEDSSFDESSYARKVAKHLRTNHHEEIFSENNLIDYIQESLSFIDEPMADPSLIPTFLLSKITARHVKVALGGDAGDELFGGYPTYKAHYYSRIFEALPEMVRAKVIPGLLSVLPVSDRYQSLEWKAKKFVNSWDEMWTSRHLRWLASLDITLLPQAIHGHLNALPEVFRTANKMNLRSNLNSMLALDFKTYLPGSVLTKVDRASMANGLETRPPFLDNELIDWVFSLPEYLKVSGPLVKLQGKTILIHAMKDKLPDDILFRPKKGFGIPIAKWIRGPLLPLVENAVHSKFLFSGSGRLSDVFFSKILKEHVDKKKDWSKPLWALLVLDIWAKKEGVYV